MGWTLEELRSLEDDEYTELKTWATERAEKHGADGDSMDADAMLEAIVAEKQKQKTAEDDGGF